MSNRTTPKELKELQEAIKNETIAKVQNAIDNLKKLGYDEIKISKLMEITELSRSTFSKDHIKEVLMKNKVGKYKDRKRIIQEEKGDYREIAKSLENKLHDAQSKIKTLEKLLEQKRFSYDKLSIEFDKLTKDYQLLVGKMQLIYMKAAAAGIEIKLDNKDTTRK